MLFLLCLRELDLENKMQVFQILFVAESMIELAMIFNKKNTRGLGKIL